MKQWRAKNPEKNRKYMTEYCRAWRDKNRGRHRENAHLSRKRRMEDPEYRATLNAKRRARRAKNPAKARAETKESFARLAAKLPWTYWLLHNAKGTSKGRFPEPEHTHESLQTLWEEQGGLCYWTRLPMIPARKAGHMKVSMDRLDNARGYTRDNVVLTTWFANRARGTMTVDEFRNTLAEVVRAFSGSFG